MPEFDSTIQYREIKGFPGYAVGTDGSVWSAWHMVRHGRRSGFRPVRGDWWKLNPYCDCFGYKTAHLRQGRKSYKVHRLVLEAFVGPRPPGTQCCHKNGDSRNNSLENIRWGTPLENSADRERHGNTVKGQKCNLAKLTEEQVLAIRAEHAADPHHGILTRLSKKYHISINSTRWIILRKTWKHI